MSEIAQVACKRRPLLPEYDAEVVHPSWSSVFQILHLYLGYDYDCDNHLNGSKSLAICEGILHW
jgi:hypothetical protein